MIAMRFTTKEAKRLAPFFVLLARLSGIDARGVRVSVSSRNRVPFQRGGTIYLPNLSDEPELYVRSFVHELRHARDVRNGLGFVLDESEMENRARTAERPWTPERVEGIVRRFVW